MPREIHFYECSICESQHESWSIAAECEFGHEMEKEERCPWCGFPTAAHTETANCDPSAIRDVTPPKEQP